MSLTEELINFRYVFDTAFNKEINKAFFSHPFFSINEGFLGLLFAISIAIGLLYIINFSRFKDDFTKVTIFAEFSIYIIIVLMCFGEINPRRYMDFGSYLNSSRSFVNYKRDASTQKKMRNRDYAKNGTKPTLDLDFYEYVRKVTEQTSFLISSDIDKDLNNAFSRSSNLTDSLLYIMTDCSSKFKAECSRNVFRLLRNGIDYPQFNIREEYNRFKNKDAEKQGKLTDNQKKGFLGIDIDFKSVDVFAPIIDFISLVKQKSSLLLLPSTYLNLAVKIISFFRIMAFSLLSLLIMMLMPLSYSLFKISIVLLPLAIAKKEIRSKILQCYKSFLAFALIPLVYTLTCFILITVSDALTNATMASYFKLMQGNSFLVHKISSLVFANITFSLLINIIVMISVVKIPIFCRQLLDLSINQISSITNTALSSFFGIISGVSTGLLTGGIVTGSNAIKAKANGLTPKTSNTNNQPSQKSQPRQGFANNTPQRVTVTNPVTEQNQKIIKPTSILKDETKVKALNITEKIYSKSAAALPAMLKSSLTGQDLKINDLHKGHAPKSKTNPDPETRDKQKTKEVFGDKKIKDMDKEINTIKEKLQEAINNGQLDKDSLANKGKKSDN